MKQIEDNKTIDMMGGVKKKPGRKRIYATAAERQAAYRTRLLKRSYYVQLEPELFSAIQDYVDAEKSHGNAVTIGQAISKLLRIQMGLSLANN